MKKASWLLIAVAIAFVTGLLVSKNVFKWPKKIVSSQQTALLERIQEVNKLVTVEGAFSEIYDYKDYYGYDWGPLRKKALIRVQAKVIAGFDLAHVEIEARPDDKIIEISNWPKPAILSIDHDLDYYDLSEGTFNRFSADDLNQLQEKAKAFIQAKAESSNLLDRAEQHGEDVIENMRFLARSSGWSIRVLSAPKATTTLD